MKVKVSCEICHNNILIYDNLSYDVFINNKLCKICNNCIKNKISKKNIEIYIYLIKECNDIKKDFIFIHKIDFYLLENKVDFDSDHILNYNKLNNSNFKSKVRSYLFKLYGGKKLILEKQNLEYIYDLYIDVKKYTTNLMKCEICGSQVESSIYFFKINNILSLVCKNCYDKVYGVKK